MLQMGHDQDAREFAAVPYHQGLLDIGASFERVLDSRAGDLLTIRQNQDLFAPARDGDAAIRIHAAQIAGGEPAVRIARLACGGFVFIISEHHVRPARQDLAILADAHFHAIEGAPHRAELLPPEFVERDYRRSLRQAIALQHRETGRPEKQLYIGIQPGAAADEIP